MKNGAASNSLLRRKKTHVAHLLSTGKSQTDAAKIAGVARETISRWKREDDEFARMCDTNFLQSTLQKLDRKDVSEKLKEYSPADFNILRYKLVGGGEDAISTIFEVMRDPDASNRDRLAAAKDILDRIGINAPKEVRVNHGVQHHINHTVLQEALHVLEVSPPEAIAALEAETGDEDDAAQ